MATTNSSGPSSRRVGTFEFIYRALNVAQTSVFLVKLQPPGPVASYLSSRGISYGAKGESIELACHQTSLPGHALQTHEVRNDYRGVTERMPYRKQYQDLSFSFYVDNEYGVIEMFEGWIDYIAGMNQQGDLNDYVNPYAQYRMNYPTDYRSDSVYVTKFEKNAGHIGRLASLGDTVPYQIQYNFVGAYPISINSTPVQYGTPDVLKYTVNMTYLRFVIDRRTAQQF